MRLSEALLQHSEPAAEAFDSPFRAVELPVGVKDAAYSKAILRLPSPRLWVEGELLAPRAGAVGIPGLRAGVEGELPILGPRIKRATRKHLGVRLFGLVA